MACAVIFVSSPAGVRRSALKRSRFRTSGRNSLPCRKENVAMQKKAVELHLQSRSHFVIGAGLFCFVEFVTRSPFLAPCEDFSDSARLRGRTVRVPQLFVQTLLQSSRTRNTHVLNSDPTNARSTALLRPSPATEETKPLLGPNVWPSSCRTPLTLQFDTPSLKGTDDC